MLEFHLLLVGLLVGTTVLATCLSILNVRYGTQELNRRSDWLSDRLDIDDPAEIIDYQRATTGLSLLRTWTVLVLLLGGLYTGMFTAAIEWLVDLGIHPALQGVIFFVGLLVARQVATAPFSLYSTFVIDEQFEFNEQTPRLWLRDFVVQLLVGMALAGAVLGVLFVLIEALPTLWWVGGGWALVVAFLLFMQILYPRVIAPLFNDFEPIQEGELRDGVEAVFDRAGFEAEEIFTMDASRRSSKLNAYFVGFGRAKRVVLFDTLVEKLDRPQIESVLAHELAHWKNGHIWKQLAVSALQLGLVFAALGYLLGTSWLYDLFAMPETSYGGLFVALLFVHPLLELSAPLVNRLSLANEREADTFAVEVMGAGEPLVEALSELARENRSNPFPHPWYAAFNHQHPPVPERMQYIEAYAGADGESSSREEHSTPG